ncbi:type III PLP-dependent enzyme [Desertibaculum subflavum]|uniref:type III PLP-dependent enzyme n=1 Tax=Desertibaculum subflavum TaxID=2268458 RepID=UPI000E6613EB
MPANTRTRLAVSPLRRSFDRRIAPAVDALVAELRPSEPLHCFRPRLARATARRFVARFPGEVLYAVKCNPEPRVLRALRAGGVQSFDVASITEARLVHQLFPDAVMRFMHPVKAREAIREAYATLGIRDFVLDSEAELAKLSQETGGASDLGLIVRLALPKGAAAYDLSGKFGAERDTAVALLRACRAAAPRIGLAFHVGSQCLDQMAYARAIAYAGEIAAEAGVGLDVLDVGGGFPLAYPGSTPPALDQFIDAIGEAVAALPAGLAPALWCEPGRALVGAATSVVVRVEHRRGQELFVNDGIYGSLSDAGAPGFRFPARLIRPDGAAANEMADFVLFGPTCDSVDRMAGPWPLPADIREGDWIEIGQLGAYGAALRTGFNGFDRARLVDVDAPPLLFTAGHPGA